MQPTITAPVSATVAPATVAPATPIVAKPATVTAPAKPKLPRVSKAKPDTAPKAAKPAKPVVVPVTVPDAEPAPRVAPIARTCATIAAQATNFGGVLSDRDSAYLAFYAGFAKAANGKPVTVRAIVDSGKRPAYNGSSKPHDAGVIVRLTKAGIITPAGDGASFTFTKRGRETAIYAAA